jgi:hypothetical protein
MARYTFVDRWTVRAPIQQVYETISDARTYPSWWPVYASVEPLVEMPPPHIGSTVRLIVKSVLGYRLALEVELVEATPPARFMTVTRGNLEGTGEWVLVQQGDTTTATWTWIVASRHRLLNLLEPVAKPLFAWSHRDASRKGARGLRQLLEMSPGLTAAGSPR